MSWQREIKILLTVFFHTLVFIMATMVFVVFFGEKLNIYIYISLLISIFLEEFIYCKLEEHRKGFIQNTIILGIPILFNIVTVFLIQGNLGFGYIIYILIVALGTYFLEGYPVNYNYYKEIVFKGVLINFAVLIFTCFFKASRDLNLIKYYILLLIATILLLRESRNYTFNIREKNSKYTNILLISFGFLGIVSNIYSIIEDIISYLGIKIFSVVTYILNILIDIIVKFMGFIARFFPESIVGKMPSKLEEIKSQGNSPFSNYVANNEGNETFYFVIKIIFVSILIFITIYIVYKIFSFVLNYKNSKEVREKYGFEEIVEKITPKEKKKSFKIGTIFKGNRTYKEMIYDVFLKFQKVAKDKNIYKNYMTATQLSNVSKIYLDKSKELDLLCEIYNEAKFSDHEIEKEKVKEMKESFKNVEKEYKKVEKQKDILA